MRLNYIEKNILNNRLIDKYGCREYNRILEYIDNIIVNKESFETINEMIEYLTLNYKTLNII